jgi:predicted anti-sigma-YlaC factor YlaD
VSSERDITCQELTEVLTDYLEGAMPFGDQVRFEAHLAICEGCVTYVTQMRQTIETMRELRPAHVEATVPDDLLGAFRAWKRGEPVPGT